MTKKELETLILNVGMPFNEGISSEDNKEQFPRLVFWEFLWDPQSASDIDYNTVVTYQLSVYTRTPRDPYLIALKDALAKKGLRPTIQHEFIEDERYFHSFMAVDIVENL